jgi:MarR family transcriptional regulator, transcriptional regulator for hemolysin
MSSPTPLADTPLASAPPSAAQQYSLGFLLADVLRLLRAEFRRQATGLRLTPALSRLLFYVDQKPGCSQAELAAFLDLSSATVGRMIDRLETGGFVRRLPDSSDRRTFRIHLDTAAAPLVARMHEALARTTDTLLLGIPPDEQAALRRTLLRMCANVPTEAP